MEEGEEERENNYREEWLSEELSPNQIQEAARQPDEPAVMRDEEVESDDSGPPGLMDMDGNIVSSSSEDEEEVARRILERQNRGDSPNLTESPNLTDTSDGEGEDSDGTEDIARFVREEGRRRLGRLNFPALLNGTYSISALVYGAKCKYSPKRMIIPNTT